MGSRDNALTPGTFPTSCSYHPEVSPHKGLYKPIQREDGVVEVRMEAAQTKLGFLAPAPHQAGSTGELSIPARRAVNAGAVHLSELGMNSCSQEGMFSHFLAAKGEAEMLVFRGHEGSQPGWALPSRPQGEHLGCMWAWVSIHFKCIFAFFRNK